MSWKIFCIFAIFNSIPFQEKITKQCVFAPDKSLHISPSIHKRTVPLRPYLQPVSKKVVSNSQCIHVLACVSLTNLPWILKGAKCFFFPEQKTDRCFPLPNTRTMLLFFFRRTCGIFLWDPTSLGGDKILCLAEGGGRTQVQQRRSTFSSISSEGTWVYSTPDDTLFPINISVSSVCIIWVTFLL